MVGLKDNYNKTSKTKKLTDKLKIVIESTERMNKDKYKVWIKTGMQTENH